jgi:hypothetical protein
MNLQTAKSMTARRERILFTILTAGMLIGIALTFTPDLNAFLDRMFAIASAVGLVALAWFRANPVVALPVFPALIAVIYLWQSRSARRYF